VRRVAVACVALALAAPGAGAAEPSGPPEEGPTTTRALLAPPQRRGLTRVSLNVRPFFNLLGPGGGALGDLAVEHQFAAPWKLSLTLAPVALAVQPGAVGSINHLRVGAAYSGDFLELGASIGSRVQNFGQGGLSLAAHLRLGAQDGLHLALTYGYAVVRNYYTSRVNVGFSNIVAAAAIPLLPRLALTAEAGFSLDVWAYTTLGLRHRLVGDGGPGTWFLRGGFGVAWVLDRFRCDYRDPSPCQGAAWAMGPTIAVGVERRF
jgi:hypothetical protein